MQKRTLTVRFGRAVTAAVPNTMEVTVTPLATASDPASNVTFVGGPQTRTVLLANEVNVVTFSLVPSTAAGLTEPMPYRIAWRDRTGGRQETHDFLMPDHDVEFADLGSGGGVGVGGYSSVTTDDEFKILNSTDNTKKARFSAALITTGTTREYGLPNTDTTLVGTNAIQTLTRKTISGTNNTLSDVPQSAVTGLPAALTGGLARANHTGTQTASTISDFPAAVDARVAAGNAATATSVTGTVAVTNGGTGTTTLAPNNVLIGNGGSPPLAVAPGAAGNVLTSDGTTWTSVAPPTIRVTLGSGGWSTPTVGSGNVTVNYTADAGSDVFVAVTHAMSTTQSVTSVTVGGVAATLVGSQFLNNASSGQGRAYLYRLARAGGGTSLAVAVTMSDAQPIAVTVGCYVNVGAVGSVLATSGTGTAASVGPVTCPPNGIVLAVLAGGAVSASTGGARRALSATPNQVVLDSTVDSTFQATTASAPWAAIAVPLQTLASISAPTAPGYGLTSVTTAAGTTTLVGTSTSNQVLTGAATQTVRLPTTPVAAGSAWTVFNKSTGAVTVQSSSAETVAVLGRDSSAVFTALTANPTTAANWVVVHDGRTPRVSSITTNSTPTINCDLYDQFNVTALATDILGFTVTGTPVDGQKLLVRIKDNGTGTTRTITWGPAFTYSGVAALLGTTVVSKTHLSGFIYDAAATRWVCVGSDAAGY
jgi:hypothetical protein